MPSKESLPSWFTPPIQPLIKKAQQKKSGHKKSRFINPQHIATYAKRMSVAGVPVKYLDVVGVSKVFKLTRFTLYLWIDAKIMPEPFYTVTTFAGAVSRLWTTSQIQATITVLNYLYSRGKINIRHDSNKDILKFIHIGSDMALDKLKRRIARAYQQRVMEKLPDIEWL
jgi:hypothetical protein